VSEKLSAAVAKKDETPAGLIDQYPAEFTAMLPSHIAPDSWLKTAKAALKRGRILTDGPNRGRYEIEVAAANNPSAFFQALREAATLGLRPGTKEYYLTPRPQKGRLEVLGIVGYQGIVELIYRAGAVSSVIVQVVREKDVFEFMPGRDEIPTHSIDWDSEDRGELRLAYAYARMKGGGYSQVVVLNRKHIERIRESSPTGKSDKGPWATDTEAMWLKSAVRQLEKWVPTSAEYREAMIRDAVAIHEARNGSKLGQIDPLPPAGVDGETGEIVDGELVEEQGAK
jgi:recombination protein RecT